MPASAAGRLASLRGGDPLNLSIVETQVEDERVLLAFKRDRRRRCRGGEFPGRGVEFEYQRMIP